MGRLVLVAMVALGAGFVLFASAVPDQQPKPGGDADGIVVLTGGSSRIQDALILLAEGHGKRLLISGVNPSTSKSALTEQTPEHEHLFACCVDIGRDAQNTIGNAIEARDWARLHGYKRLILVTSNYHLPRSMAEFAFAMPEAEWLPYPVVPDGMRPGGSWTSPEMLRLMLGEYAKYLAARVRHGLNRMGIAMERFAALGNGRAA